MPASCASPLDDVFALPIFVSAVRSFTLLPQEEHAPRVTVGRMVLRRESWSIPAAEIPERAEDVAAFARDRGMPRRVFMKSPLERKPMYLDTESPVLSRILCRQARHARETPGARMEFTEMLPGPDECWLADADGEPLRRRSSAWWRSTGRPPPPEPPTSGAAAAARAARRTTSGNSAVKSSSGTSTRVPATIPP